jgi:hypothetical protein
LLCNFATVATPDGTNRKKIILARPGRIDARLPVGDQAQIRLVTRPGGACWRPGRYWTTIHPTRAAYMPPVNDVAARSGADLATGG